MKEGRNGPAHDYDLDGAGERDDRFKGNGEIMKPGRRGNKTIMGSERVR